MLGLRGVAQSLEFACRVDQRMVGWAVQGRGGWWGQASACSSGWWCAHASDSSEVAAWVRVAQELQVHRL